jgi:Mg-chelatase subunit ChlD
MPSVSFTLLVNHVSVFTDKVLSMVYSKNGFSLVWIFLASLILCLDGAHAAEPKVRILSPKDGAQITQEQDQVLVSGKVATDIGRSPNVDILFVLDVSGSTANYAGVDFGDLGQVPDNSGFSGLGRPQIGIGGIVIGGQPPLRNLRNSILAAEVAAARRLLLQLNSQTTRLGLVTFSEGARVMQPLTHDFAQVRHSLDEIMRAGPYGGTNMAEGIRAGIKELLGLGTSAKRVDAIKVQFLLTDGYPTLPIGEGKRATPQDTQFAINAARLAGKAGIKIHVFALGEDALSYPQAAVGVAKESGGTYTPVVRAADVLAVIEKISVVGVDYVQVVNETLHQRATQLRLAADGFFSSAVPVTRGVNRIQVLARASDGSVGRDAINLYYQPGGDRSLDLEVFLEKEKSLKLEVERLGKSPEQIQSEVEHQKEGGAAQGSMPPSQESNVPR